MISWMQKHNRYLVWTIWIATIAFIGAGFVGWGSYQFGVNPDKIAKVGDVEISKSKYDFVYASIYENYNKQLNGQLDEAKAKELNISAQAMSMVESQAKLLNLAKHYGIDISKDEIAKNIQNTDAFKVNGVFDKELYNQQLSSMRLKPSAYDEMLKDEITITKLLYLLKSNPTIYENTVISSSLLAQNNIAYQVLTENDVNIDTSDDKLRLYWSKNKNDFMHQEKYELDILWTPLNKDGISQKEITNLYNQESYKYVDVNGKTLPLEQVKDSIKNSIAAIKSKKAAQKEYIDFKNNKIKASEKIIVSDINISIPQEILNEVKQLTTNSILKPKVIGDRYATIKIVNKIQPKVKSFEEAKEEVIKKYRSETSKTSIQKLAKDRLKTIDKTSNIDTKTVSIRSVVNLNGLNNEESAYFLQKLFTSTEKNGIIAIGNKVIVYNILSKNLLTMDKNEEKMVYRNSYDLKKSIFEINLLKFIDKKYVTTN